MPRKKPAAGHSSFTRVKGNPDSLKEYKAKFESHFTAARGLLTVGPDSQVWEGTLPTLPAKLDVKGFIVRVRPPATAEDSRIEAVKKFLIGQGAVKVFAEPKPRGEVLPSKSIGWDEGEPSGPREMVKLLIANANTQDRIALAAAAEQVMAEEGL